MRKAILQLVKAIFPLLAGLSIFTGSAYSQQNIIADKDNTRPETGNQYINPVKITSFSASAADGYNDIQWSAFADEETRKFIVEYSTDGVNFQSAGETLPAAGKYSIKHYTRDNRPLLYRLRIENIKGKFYNSPAILLEGTAVLPVSIYPTLVKGDMINVNAGFPVERTSIVSVTGTQVLAKDMNGASGYVRLPIPSLEQGIYFVTFYGNGWQSTSKFIIAR